MFIIGWKPEGYIDDDVARQFEEANPEKQAKRSAFEIDKGRIIHSSAFRRLQGKTQVLLSHSEAVGGDASHEDDQRISRDQIGCGWRPSSSAVSR
jgi:hypothetical protein